MFLIPKQLAAHLKTLPKQLYYREDFSEKYTHPRLCADIMVYIRQNFPWFSNGELPLRKNIEQIFFSQKVTTLSGFIKAIAEERSHNYSYKDILEAVTELSRNNHLLAFPVLDITNISGNKKLVGDLILLSNRSGNIAVLKPFLDIAGERNYQFILDWLNNIRLGKTLNTISSQNFSIRSFSFAEELHALLFYELLDPDKQCPEIKQDNPFNGSEMINEYIKNLVRDGYLDIVQMSTARENLEVKKQNPLQYRALPEIQKLIIENLTFYALKPELQTLANEEKDFAKYYRIFFLALQHYFNDKIKVNLIQNNKNKQLIPEYEDLTKQSKEVFPIKRLSEVLLSLFNDFIQDKLRKIPYKGKDYNIFIYQNQEEQDIYYAYKIFKSLHEQALADGNFKFYDLNAEKLFQEIYNSIAEKSPTEIFTVKDYQNVIVHKEQSLKAEVEKIFNANTKEITPFDYEQYLQNPEMPLDLINSESLPQLIKYKVFYEKDNYYLIPGNLFRNKSVEDQWGILNLAKIAKNLEENNGSGKNNNRLKFLQDLIIRLIPILENLNKIDYNLEKKLLLLKLESFKREFKSVMNYYEIAVGKTKIFNQINTIISKRLALMEKYKDTHDRDEALKLNNPLRGFITAMPFTAGTFFGTTISILKSMDFNIFTLIVSFLGGIVSAIIIGSFFTRIFGRKWRKGGEWDLRWENYKSKKEKEFTSRLDQPKRSVEIKQTNGISLPKMKFNEARVENNIYKYDDLPYSELEIKNYLNTKKLTKFTVAGNDYYIASAWLSDQSKLEKIINIYEIKLAAEKIIYRQGELEEIIAQLKKLKKY